MASVHANPRCVLDAHLISIAYALEGKTSLVELELGTPRPTKELDRTQKQVAVLFQSFSCVVMS